MYYSQGAVAAIRACLKLIAKRDTRQRVKWYFQVYNEAGKVNSLYTDFLCISSDGHRPLV